MSDYEPMSDAEWLRKELFAARAERDALRVQLAEAIFRAFQEGYNSSLSYVGEDGMAAAWEVSDAKASIDAALKGK